MSSPSLIRNVTVAAAIYAIVCLAFLFQLPWLHEFLEACPRWLVVSVAMLSGPAALLSGGRGALSVFVVVVGIIAALLGLSRIVWKRYPESEAFAVAIAAAVVVWVGIGWLVPVSALYG